MSYPYSYSSNRYTGFYGSSAGRSTGSYYGNYQSYGRSDELRPSEKEKIDHALYGLINPMGSYNCSLNGVIQAYWNLDVFREFFLFISIVESPHDSALIKSIKRFFFEVSEKKKDFYDAEDQIIDPSEI